MTFDGRIEAEFTVPSSIEVSATNSGGGPTVVSLTAGTYYLSDFVTHLVARLNAVRTPATWSGSVSTGASGTGQVTLNWSGDDDETYSIAWTDADTPALLGFAGDLTAVAHDMASVGTKQARGLWIPDHPLRLDTNTPRAPIVTDAMACVSPRGEVTTLVGNTFYRHTGLLYSNVAESRIWEAVATIANASWERFWSDAQLGQGDISWFTSGSRLRIYDHLGRELGAEANGGTGVDGWVASRGPFDLEVKRSDSTWAGHWRIEIPELISSG